MKEKWYLVGFSGSVLHGYKYCGQRLPPVRVQLLPRFRVITLLDMQSINSSTRDTTTNKPACLILLPENSNAKTTRNLGLVKRREKNNLGLLKMKSNSLQLTSQVAWKTMTVTGMVAYHLLRPKYVDEKEAYRSSNYRTGRSCDFQRGDCRTRSKTTCSDCPTTRKDQIGIQDGIYRASICRRIQSAQIWVSRNVATQNGGQTGLETSGRSGHEVSRIISMSSRRSLRRSLRR
jgi:hypothetical protein